jgi:hypothetical protein
MILQDVSHASTSHSSKVLGLKLCAAVIDGNAFRPEELNRFEVIAFVSKGNASMWIRLFGVAAICLACAPQANASGILHRASCTLVRFYVAKYSAPTAEAWARSKGATDAEIAAARLCIKNAPVQTAAVQNSPAR